MDVYDIENMVFDDVASVLRATFDGIAVYGEYVETSNVFPSASLYEIGEYEVSQNLSGESTHFAITLQLDVYSNRKSGKKSECKAIARKAQEVIESYGFHETMFQPTPNLYDATIYRITARYERTFAEGDLARFETND